MCKSVTYQGICYNKNAAVVYAYDNEYLFGNIENIVYVNGCLHFILKWFETVQFMQHIHAYVLKETNKFCSVNSSTLLSPFPLPIYSYDNNMVVIMPFFVQSGRQL